MGLLRTNGIERSLNISGWTASSGGLHTAAEGGRVQELVGKMGNH